MFSIKKKVKGGSGGGTSQPAGYKTLPSNSSSPVHSAPPHAAGILIQPFVSLYWFCVTDFLFRCIFSVDLRTGLAISIKSDSRQTNINTCSCQNLTSRIILIYLKEHCLNTGYCLMTQIFTLDYRDVSHIIIKAGGGSDTFWNNTKSQRNSTK